MDSFFPGGRIMKRNHFALIVLATFTVSADSLMADLTSPSCAVRSVHDRSEAAILNEVGEVLDPAGPTTDEQLSMIAPAASAAPAVIVDQRPCGENGLPNGWTAGRLYPLITAGPDSVRKSSFQIQRHLPPRCILQKQSCSARGICQVVRRDKSLR